MKTAPGKTLVGLLLGIVFSLGSVVWISGERTLTAPITDTAPITHTASMMTGQIAGQGFAHPVSDKQSTSNVDDTSAVQSSTDEQSYDSGYRDGWRDASESRRTSSATSQVRHSRAAYSSPRTAAYSSPRTSAGGAKYYAARRSGHSTRNTILTVAAPAALAAGAGAIAGGKKAAGIGALLGGGAGALYHVIRNRR